MMGQQHYQKVLQFRANNFLKLILNSTALPTGYLFLLHYWADLSYALRFNKLCDQQSPLVLFGMAAMPFPINGILLIQVNLPRVIPVVFQMYRNIMLVFISPISIFYFCLWGMVKLSVLNIFTQHLNSGQNCRVFR